MSTTVAVKEAKKLIKPQYGEVWTIENDFGGEWTYMVVSNDVGNKASKIFMGVAIIPGRKRKPTQMQWGENVVMFESMATLSIERLIEKKGTVHGNFSYYIEAVSKEFTERKTGVQYLYPRYDIEQWGAYFIDLGEGRGSEQGGERLVVVSSNSILNNTGKVTVIPATTRLKRSLATHVDIPESIGIPHDSTLMLEQMTTVDASKFQGTQMVAKIPQELIVKILVAKDVATSEQIKTVADIRRVQEYSINKWVKKNA